MACPRTGACEYSTMNENPTQPCPLEFIGNYTCTGRSAGIVVFQAAPVQSGTCGRDFAYLSRRLIAEPSRHSELSAAIGLRSITLDHGQIGPRCPIWLGTPLLPPDPGWRT